MWFEKTCWAVCKLDGPPTSSPSGRTHRARYRARSLRWPPCSNGPIWARSLPAFDEFRFRRGRVNSFSVTSHSAGRLNHRPRRGERRHCPEDFDGLFSFFSFVFFFVFSGITRPMRAKKREITIRNISARGTSSTLASLLVETHRAFTP